MTRGVTFRIPVDDGEAYWSLPSSLANAYDQHPEAQEALRRLTASAGGMFFIVLSGLFLSGDEEGIRGLHDALALQAEAAITRIKRRQP